MSATVRTVFGISSLAAAQGTHKSTIVGARGAEIGATNDRLAAAELVGVFCLQRPETQLEPRFHCAPMSLEPLAAGHWPVCRHRTHCSRDRSFL